MKYLIVDLYDCGECAMRKYLQRLEYQRSSLYRCLTLSAADIIRQSQTKYLLQADVTATKLEAKVAPGDTCVRFSG